MPKVIIDPKQGLIQRPGSGLVVKSGMAVNNPNTMTGQRKALDTSIDDDISLTSADSGKVFILGGTNPAQGAYTISFPVDVAGWNARFYTTGALDSDITISGTAAPTTGTPVTMFTTILSQSFGATGNAAPGIQENLSTSGTGSVSIFFKSQGGYGTGVDEHMGDFIDINVGVSTDTGAGVVFATGLMGSGSTDKQGG